MFYQQQFLLNWVSKKDLPFLNNLGIETNNDIKEIVFQTFPKNKYNIKNLFLFQNNIPLNNQNEEISIAIKNNTPLQRRILSLPYSLKYEDKLNFLQYNKKAFQTYRYDLIVKTDNNFQNYQELLNYINEMSKYLTNHGLLVFSLPSKNSINQNQLNYEDFNNFLIFKKIDLLKEFDEESSSYVYLIQKQNYLTNYYTF